MIVGITGGSGSGKSEISKIFAKYGALVIDADIIAREIVNDNSPILIKIKETFGDEIVNASNELDRRKLASIVFSDKEELKKLNSITHPAITEEIKNIIEKNKENYKLFVIDAAVLVDCDLISLCNVIVVVIADDKIRLKRIIDRDNISKDEAIMRINSQRPHQELCDIATFIVNNDGELHNLENDVKTICEFCKK